MSDQSLTGLSVLVADDSAVNRVLLTKTLERAGARVFGVANGREAVELVQARGDELDAVLMDLQMPELDGEQATRIIRGELGHRRLPILALSAGVLDSDRAQAIAAGMDDFVQKPFVRQDLIARVASHVERFRSRTPTSAPANGATRADWPEIDGIDTADVQARLAGDHELFRSLLGRLGQELDDFCAEARGDGAPGKLEHWAARLHKLRGMAGNLGARRLAQAALELEKRARAADPELGTGLISLCAQAMALSDALRAAPAVARPALDESLAAPSVLEWQRFIAALDDQDLDALESFAHFSAWLCARIGAGRHDELRTALHALEFARARALAVDATPQLFFEAS
ncbi:MAG: response regulator [Myxococcota bacterium]|nr:response regulator [Myxococcota bacterium]